VQEPDVPFLLVHCLTHCLALSSTLACLRARHVPYPHHQPEQLQKRSMKQRWDNWHSFLPHLCLDWWPNRRHCRTFLLWVQDLSSFALVESSKPVCSHELPVLCQQLRWEQRGRALSHLTPYIAFGVGLPHRYLDFDCGILAHTRFHHGLGSRRPDYHVNDEAHPLGNYHDCNLHF